MVGGRIYTCFHGFTRTWGATTLGSLSLNCHGVVQATGEAVKRTTGICGLAAVQLPSSLHLSQEGDTAHRVSPAKHCCAVVTIILHKCDGRGTRS